MENISTVLEQYDSDNQQIRSGSYYFIDETQLFRVKHVLSYLEANRQVSFCETRSKSGSEVMCGKFFLSIISIWLD